MKTLDIKDGSENDLVATASNLIHDIVELSSESYRKELEELSVWIIRYLAGETEDMELPVDTYTKSMRVMHDYLRR